MSDNQDVISQIHDTLAEAGLHVVVEVRDGTVYLAGEVDSEENRQAVLDVATAVAEAAGLNVDDTLDVLPDAPESLGVDARSDERGGFAYLDPDRDDNLSLDPGFDGEPDFTERIGTTDSMESAAEAIPYFPPTDPVIRPSDDAEEIAILGGFEATSMDGDEQAASYDDRPDEDISEQVLHELRQDALTTELVIQAITRNGVVHLRGEVPTLEDAENAEAVASRVSGVKEVVEELEVASVRDSPRREA